MLDLDIDLTQVDTEYPSAAIGDHHMRITKVEQVPWKSDTSKSSLAVQFTNAEPVISTKGRELAPGALVSTWRLALQQHDSERAPDFKIDLAKLVEAAYGEKVRLNNDNLLGLVGKEVLVTFKAAKDTQYGDTEIKGVKKLA